MNRKRIILTLLTFLAIALGSVTAWAFSTQWSTQFDVSGEPAPDGGVDLPDWDEYHIGSCDGDAGGQAHSVGGSVLNMAVNGNDTACFGAYYRDNDSWPSTFPTDKDVRVMWRYMYTSLAWMGTQAGQVTGRYGGPQYAGISGVNNSQKNIYHLESDGSWGSWDVNNPMWSSSATNTWHQSTFDFLCDGQYMQWFMDGSSIHTASGPALSPYDPARPYQFWMGNLLTSGGGGKYWTNFSLDYVYIYTVERPKMIAPTPGGQGTQAVSWDPVPNTTQPDGSAWGIQYQVRVCTDSACASVVQTSPWQSGTSYTFTGLPVNATYTYQARAKWVGTPELTTCWGSAQSAMMGGDPVIGLTKTATASAKPGGVIQYTLTVKNTGTGPATGVTVTDPIPTYILNPSGISSGGSVKGSNVTWSLSSISAGGSVTLSWSGTVDAAIPVSASKINNSATACDNANHCGSATASTTINQPALIVNKTATALVWPGGNVSYQITVRNAGNTSLTGVTVTDPIPNYVANPTGISNGGVAQSGKIVWNLGTLATGASVTLSWSGTIDAEMPATVSQIVNTATGAADGGLSDQGQATSAVGQPVLEIDKTAPAKSGPGWAITYQITVRNTGEAQATGVTVTDPIPNYVTNPTDISHAGTTQGGNIVWDVGTLSAGASVALSWSGTVDAAIPPSKLTLENTATVCDGGERCAEDSAITELFKADAWFDKEANAYSWPGDTIAYTLTVRNTSMVTLTHITVRDPVPAGIFYPRQISSSGAAIPSPFEGNIEIVWRPADLGPGKQTVLTWRGTADPEIPAGQTAIRNVATLTTNEGVVRQAEGSTYILHQGATLTKAAPMEAGPGETIPYTITVKNPTLAPLSEVVVRDYIPEYVISPTNIAGGGAISTAGEIVWNVGGLAVGESKVLTWRGTVDPAIPADETTILNRAEASDNTIDTVEATAATELKLQNVRLSKSAPYNVTAGAVITYQLTVENTGAATLYDLEVRDPVPGYVLTPTTVTPGGVLEGNTTLVWRLNSLAAGQATTLQWQGTVSPDIPASQASILNTAELKTGGGLKRSAQARSYIGRPELGLSKRATLSAGPGETVVYTLTVQNNGSGPLNGVEVVDTLPEYVINPRNFSLTGGEARVDGVYWTMGTLQPGESKVLTWQGTVDRAIPADKTVIINRAKASDSSGQTVQATAVTNLKAQSVRLSQYAPYSVMAGMAITYRLVVENTGATALYDLEVRDPAPAYILNPTAITDGGVFEGNTAMVWRLDSLAPGQTVVLEWRGTVDPAIPASQASILNTANLLTGSGLERSAQARSYIGLPELALTKRASTPAGPGDPIAYTLTARNTGQGPLNSVEVYDFIPDYVIDARNAGRDGEVQAEEIYWAVGTLGPGESRILTWEGSVDPLIPAGETGILNEAEARDASGQTVQAEGFTELKGQDARLSLSAPYSVMARDGVTYRISVENAGAATLYHLEVRDLVPAYVLNPTTITTGGGVEGNITIVWRLDSLAAGETATFEWSGEISPDIPEGQASILNTANLTTGGGLSRSAQARSYVGRPELVLTGWGPAEVGPGEPIAYALTVQNTGQGPLDEVKVFDPRPAYVGDARNVGPAGETRADGIYWSVGTLEPGESRILTWEGTVDRHIPADEAYLVNEAQAYDGSGRTAEVEIPAELKRQSARFGLSAPYSIAAGAGVTYRLTVENAGAATLYDLEVRDPAPAYVLNPSPVTAGGVFEGNTAMVLRLDNLPAGQTAVFEWNGVIDPAIPASQKTILNSAGLNTGGGLQQNAQAQSYIGRPELAVTRWATTEAGPGDTVAGAVTIENMGQGSLTAVEVFDPLPEYITSAREADNGGEVRADGVYWSVGTLGPGESRVLTWQGTVDPLIPEGVREIAGTAQVSSAELAGSARAVTRILAQRVYFYATATAQVWPGGTVDYGIVIRNRGEATLRQVEVRDPLPGGITGVANASYGGELEGNTELVWFLDEIPAGAEVILTWQGTVDPALSGGRGIIRNEVSLSTGGGLEREASAESAVIQPDLRLHHEATLSAGPGEPVVYTLTVQNAGGSDLPEVTVSAPIPEYITDAREADNDGQVRADEVYWAIGTLSAGESRVLTWQGTVDPLIPEGVGEIAATARVSGAGLKDESRVVTRVPAQRVYLYATATSLVWPGGTADYGLVIRNRGEATLREVEVRDPLPSGIVGAAEISHGGALEGNTELVWFLDEIPAGEQVVLTWQGTVDPALAIGQKVIRNEASLTTGSGLEREASAESAILRPALRLHHEATVSAGPGEPVVYTLTVQNAGGSNLPEVIVSAPIPEYIAGAREADNGGQVRADEVYWAIGPLSAGESRVLTWRGTVDPLIPDGIGEIVATAQAGGAGLEDESRAMTRVPAQRVYLYATATSLVWPGGTVAYGIVVRNSGEATLRQVEVRDPLPNGTVGAAEISHNGRLEGNTELVWLLDAIPAGEEVTLTWQATVDPAISGGTIRNEVSLRTGGGLKQEARAETAVENTSERLQLLLAHEATVSAGPGETVVYTLTAQNAGGSNLPAVTVSAPIPEYITGAREADNGGQVRADEVYWAIGTLSAGESRVLTWQGTVDPLIPEGVGEIVATAQVSGAGLEDESRVVTRVPAQRVYLYATATAQVWPGGTVNYGIVIRNRGEATLREVEVRDPLPSGTVGAAEISHGGELEGNTELVWFLDAIPAGQEVVLTWQGTVDPALAIGQKVVRNEVSLTTGGGLEKEAQAESAILRAQLLLRNEATPQAGPGEAVVYTLTVRNLGEAMTVPGVEVHDPLPATLVNPTGINAGGVIDFDEIIWKVGDLGPGERRILTWEGFIPLTVPVTVTQIANEAVVSDLSGLKVKAGTQTTVLRPSFRLSQIGPEAVGAGEPITYTLQLTNTSGMILRQAVITGAIPAYVLSPTVTGGLSGAGVITWPVDALLPGESCTTSWSGMVDRDIPATVTRIAAHAQATARPGLTASAIADTRVYPPVLAVTQTGPAAVIPGQAVTYQIKLTNQGLGTIYRLRTEDNLSPYLLPREISRSGYEVPGRIVWDALGDLPPGQAVTLDWSGTVADDIPGSVFTLTNVTRATARGGVAVEARTDSGLLSPGLALTKLSITATQAGGDLPYTITIRNNGPGLARGVVVRDQIPAYVNPLPASLSGVTRAGDALVWEIGRMDAGAALTMTWVGRVDMDIPASVAQIVNRAEVSSFDQSASVVAEAVTALHDPALRLSFVCPAVSQAGETIPYQLRLTNAGVGALRALQVNLPVTETIQYIAGSGLPAPDGSAPPRWTMNALAPGASVDLAFAMRIDPDVTTDTVTSEAQVMLAGRVASWAGCTTRLARPVLTLEETAPATALLNDAIPYTLTVKNAGEVTAYGATLTDTLPAMAIAVPGSVSDGGAPGTAAIVWPLGDLAPGQAVSRTFRAQVTASPAAAPAESILYDENGRLIIYNTATISANRSEPVSASATTLGTRPTLTLRKTGDAIAGLGQTVVYTLTAGNDGPGLARLVSLQDRLPDGLVLQSDPSLEGGYYSAADHAVTWALGDMPAGQVVTRTVTMIVPEMYYSPSDILINRATLSSPDSSPAYGQATTGIYSEFELAATKQASTQSYPGGEIDYAITLRNTGSNRVGDVVVSDPLPAYTAYLDGSASLPPEYDPDAHALVWRLGSVASGETREVRFRLVVGDDLPDWVDRVTNRAEITFSGGNVSASAITLLPGASLGTSSASTPATPRPPSSSGPVSSGSPMAPISTLTASASPVATASPAASQALLPVTGGLIDPRTPGGKIVWAGALLLLLAWRWRAGKTPKSEPSNKASEETKND